MRMESVALASGLSFIPLAEERFDLVIHAAMADAPPVCRLFEALDSRSFREEAAHIPGYDASQGGQVTVVHAH